MTSRNFRYISILTIIKYNRQSYKFKLSNITIWPTGSWTESKTSHYLAGILSQAKYHHHIFPYTVESQLSNLNGTKGWLDN